MIVNLKDHCKELMDYMELALYNFFSLYLVGKIKGIMVPGVSSVDHENWVQNLVD